MLRSLTILMFVARSIKLDTRGHSIAPRLKVGDLYLTQAPGLPRLSLRVIARLVEFNLFVGDRMSDGTKRVLAFAKQPVRKAVTNDYRGSTSHSYCCFACFYFRCAFRPPRHLYLVAIVT